MRKPSKKSTLHLLRSKSKQFTTQMTIKIPRGYQVLCISYASVVRSYKDIIICTKLNIPHIVNVVRRYIDCLRKIHQQVDKWIF